MKHKVKLRTEATIALLAKCHAEIEIVVNRIDSLRKLQAEIKVVIAQQQAKKD